MKLLGSLLVSSAFAQTVSVPTTITPTYPSQLEEIEQGCIRVISNLPGTDEAFVENWTIKAGIFNRSSIKFNRMLHLRL